ncbi:flagellar motor switch protein FliM [Chitinimonas sp. BJB300]|uniref:flagellar motor switch protein FliM n=1 Tax=Chitinimonas sp. BJB300 TaxID=1559339 RepID=UPI000C110925|nr:flagellar motor switch protein FliM [Chitinimonas sp. BJB300]PHV13089.1 flagellar motor switch protein FliM [Chitinimonas sp. BJB300]TSJ84686.1 flagellar motor switch protein FliM [Chitinimonas sp. BJB300]
MSDDILSQEEVDALLRGVTGEDDDADEGMESSSIRSYDIGRQERIVRGRMPTLEVINERFARNLRIGIFNFMRRSAEISVGPVRVQKYSEFIRNLVVPTNLNLIHMKPLRGTGLFIFDPDLVFLVVDNMFGSDGRYHVRVEGRDFTPTEQRIIQRLLEVVMEEYRKSWEPVFKTEFSYVRSEMNTQFANIATPTEVVVAFTFKIELGTGGGDFHVCFPYSMIEPLRDLLYSSMQADRMESDNRWVKLLSSEIQNSDVDLIANLGTAQITLRDILDLKAGDVIGINIPETIVAEVDGVPLIQGYYGTLNGQYALKVDKIISTPDSQKLDEEPVKGLNDEQ